MSPCRTNGPEMADVGETWTGDTEAIVLDADPDDACKWTGTAP